MVELSKGAKTAIKMLENEGFEAYAVGGCVRDSLLLQNPSDFDITTSAFPDEIKSVFKNEHIIETGIKHGTVTVLIEGESLEITTFRIEKDYLDNRHPNKVLFTRSLKNDLARRDFTINAMAYNEKNGITDLFGGILDLEHRIIRTVGNADERFSEDALRIMRALRFSSVLGFEIENETAKSVCKNRKLLKKVSAERIFSELTKLVCGKNAVKTIFEHGETLFEILPELSVLKNFDGQLYTESVAALELLPPKPTLRFAAFFNCVAAPVCENNSCDGAQKNAAAATEILKRFRCDNKTLFETKTLIFHCDDSFDCSRKTVKQFLNKIGAKAFEELLLLKNALESQKPKDSRIEKSVFDEMLKIEQDVLSKNECYSLKSLAIDGFDLISEGFESGNEIGEILTAVLEKVMQNEVSNRKEELIFLAKTLKSDRSCQL